MTIQHETDGKKGAFYVEIEGERLAEMTYTAAGATKFIIDHTEVSDKLRGKGVGLQLVKASVAYAREHNLKIMPLCPFAKSVFDKKEELRDVLM